MKTFFIAAAGAAVGTFLGCSVHQASVAKASTLQDFGVCEITSVGTDKGDIQVLDCNRY